jgi:hypothetical protein
VPLNEDAHLPGWPKDSHQRLFMWRGGTLISRFRIWGNSSTRHGQSSSLTASAAHRTIALLFKRFRVIHVHDREERGT